MAEFTQADGIQLAADMLREMAEHLMAREETVEDITAAELDALWRNDRAEILRRHVDTIRDRRSPELEQGFYAVLTDFIGSCLEGAVPDIDCYEREASHG